MPRFFEITLLLMTILLIFSTLPLCFEFCYADEIYTLPAEITDANTNGYFNVITCTDNNGEMWECETSENCWIGDNVILTMSDNNTPNNIFDDIILNLDFIF